MSDDSSRTLNPATMPLLAIVLVLDICVVAGGFGLGAFMLGDVAWSDLQHLRSAGFAWFPLLRATIFTLLAGWCAWKSLHRLAVQTRSLAKVANLIVLIARFGPPPVVPPPSVTRRRRKTPTTR